MLFSSGRKPALSFYQSFQRVFDKDYLISYIEYTSISELKQMLNIK